MEFVNGGELYYHLQSSGSFSTDRTRFYTAELVLAIEYLHKNGIIYRDLKPENILIDSEGHLKITDFGLSKEGLLDPNSRTKTFCGTAEYLAPEVILGNPYSLAVDWWSLGTLMYEMITGLPAFFDNNVQMMYKYKMNADIQMPEELDDNTKNIILRLLDKDPTTRIQNPDEIKAHPYFAGINWENLINKTATPPYIPNIKNKESTAMIDREFTRLSVDREIKKGQNVDNTEFPDFSYTDRGEFMKNIQNDDDANSN